MSGLARYGRVRRCGFGQKKYVLVSLPTSSLSEAANIVGRSAGAFAALILERDEVSLTLPEHVWSAHAVKANAQDGPYRAVSFNVDVDLEVFRSEEHTSELQSHSDLVCRLLLEKKK